MLHVANQDSKTEVKFEFPEDERFVSFITTTQNYHDVEIRVLLLQGPDVHTLQDTEDSDLSRCNLIFRTYRYEKPYQYRDFVKEDWSRPQDDHVIPLAPHEIHGLFFPYSGSKDNKRTDLVLPQCV